ncbi:AGC/PKN protein kinase [Aphelenchoides avenae]|nr:AGC/PKN protein kinase [Aphelenchus avenae]
MEPVPEEVAEIATKFKFNWTSKSFQKDVADLKKKIRAELSKELRMKHGYVQLQKATKDRKQNETIKTEIRDLCDLISDMQCDLQTLSMYDTGAFGA